MFTDNLDLWIIKEIKSEDRYLLHKYTLQIYLPCSRYTLWILLEFREKVIGVLATAKSVWMKIHSRCIFSATHVILYWGVLVLLAAELVYLFKEPPNPFHAYTATLTYTIYIYYDATSTMLLGPENRQNIEYRLMESVRPTLHMYIVRREEE